MLSVKGTTTLLLALFASVDVSIANGEFERLMNSNIRKTSRKLRLKNARDNLSQAIKSKVRPLASTQRALGADDDGNDDYFDDVNQQYNNFQFNVTNYSLKYARCQMIQSYSDEYGQEEFAQTVLKRQTFVVFRFCNTDYCSSNQMFGCDMDYGEYLIDLNDYLGVMQQYNEERKEAYCEYCEECMELEDADDDAAADEEEAEDEEEEAEEEEEEEEEEEDAGDDAGRRRLDEGDEAGDDGGDEAGDDAGDEAGDDAGDAGDDGGDAADDGDAAGDDAADAGDDAVAAGDDAAAAAADDGNVEHACEAYDQCYNYQDTCEADNDDAVDYDDLLQCAEYAYGDDDGQVYYVGPTCASDGVSIQLGVFADQDCSEYVEGIDVENLIGMDLAEDGFGDYYQNSCISCRESDLPWQQVDEDQEDGDDVSEICENLWGESAKCNRYYNEVMDYSYGSDEQEDAEKMVCYYIENILSGQYNENGEIYVDGDLYDQQNAPHDNSYAYQVTSDQLIAMGASFLLCFVLLLYSCHLHSLILNKAPWSPNRVKGSASVAGAVSRQNSGIVMGRSRSGGEYPAGGTIGTLA
eukprot:CAMPEP_0194355436 /NCGR_PEP_ID=MMETSP0174-20130528/3344_1 /TAXON_ID=216777 /ORGANISM="Proboscia alata, Strain PI-D3" /LENGTH=579 /DNA_ID=CAMNT_0039124711 /DNA_START=89 /DNA_END=1828 /DNA_ORIENTATION=+